LAYRVSGENPLALRIKGKACPDRSVGRMGKGFRKCRHRPYKLKVKNVK
jgi:hypothetical protein